MAKNKRQSAVDSNVLSIIKGSNSEKEKTEEQTKPVATRLEFEDADRLQAVADEMGVKIAVVVRLSILKYLKAWDEGDRPSKVKKVVEVWDIE